MVAPQRICALLVFGALHAACLQAGPPVPEGGLAEPAPDPRERAEEQGGEAVTRHVARAKSRVERASAEARAAAAAHPVLGTPPRPCPGSDVHVGCVGGGWFLLGVDDDPHRCTQSDQPRDGAPSNGPRRAVWLESFRIDRTEVTFAAYQSCVAQGLCPPARPRYRDFDDGEQPMTGMSWFDARAFCQARGGDLPTEAQWEAAAVGPLGERTPFGEHDVDCTTAVIEDERGRSCGVLKEGSSPETGRVLPVGSRPAGRYGLFDMAGNAEEWVLDWWSEGYDACGAACSGPNPMGPCEGALRCPGHTMRVVRGGSWYWPASHATGAHRRRYRPSNQPPHHFGFRCAYPVNGGP